MIIVRYRGGLGNQMFQYAFSYALKKKFPEQEIYADITNYEINNEHNGFEIEDCFQRVAISKAPNSLLRKYSPLIVPIKGSRYLPNIVRKHIYSKLQVRVFEKKSKEVQDITWYYHQPNHNTYDEELLNKIADVIENKKYECIYLDGLWQDIRYFDEYREEIREIYSLDSPKTRENNTVGIHVRGGDFANSKFDICSKEYYQEALKKIVNIGKKKVIVFTDDISKVALVLDSVSHYDIVNNGPKNAIDDMRMMSQCRELIISNSTFAFWAAYVGDNINNVIAPRYSIIKKDGKMTLYVPKEWIVVDNDRYTTY